MIQPATLKFLKDLQKNNNKPWFDKHRGQYETARADFNAMIGLVIPAIAKFDKPIGALSVKECIFRINRDVRFSKDKRPYKNNMSAYFNKGGKKSDGAGYYLHIEAGRSFVAGGMWVPLPADLAKIRQEIDYSLEEWEKITQSKAFKKFFPSGVTSDEALVRPPKGYDENNPAIEFLKMKNFVVRKSFTDAEVLSKNFVKDAAKALQGIKPLVEFLNKAIE